MDKIIIYYHLSYALFLTIQAYLSIINNINVKNKHTSATSLAFKFKSSGIIKTLTKNILILYNYKQLTFINFLNFI
jgi:hypothetical protein